MLWKIGGSLVAPADQEGQQAWKMGKVTRDQSIASFIFETVADAARWVVGLEIRRCGKLRECIAGFPVLLRGLASAKLAAVPDDVGSSPTGGDLTSPSGRLLMAERREGPARVDLRTNGLGVVNEKQLQW